MKQKQPKTVRQTEYASKFRDPRWQKKRLLILDRDEWTCQKCYGQENTLNVHHRYYRHGKDPWDYDDAALVTLCETCHEDETATLSGSKQVLIECMSEAGFFSSDLHDIALAFHEWKGCFDERHSSAISWAIRTPGVFNSIVDAYFNDLKERNTRNREAKKAEV